MTFRFEPATSYRTRGGFEAYVLRNQRRYDALYGYVFTPDGSRSATVSVAPMLTCWNPDGRISPANDSRYDLMDPGSLIEPAGPREINDPEYDVSRLGPNGSARREAKIEVDTFGGPRPSLGSVIMTDDPAKMPMPKHENVSDRIDRIEGQIENLVKRIIAVDRIQADGRRMLETRLAKSDEEAALNLVATDARLDRLSGMINDLSQSSERIDNIEKHCEAMDARQSSTKTVLGAMNDAIGRLETLPGLATLNAAVVDINDRLDRFAQARADGADLKPVRRKGGWINVYAKDLTGAVAGPVAFETKWAADQAALIDNGTRIACVEVREGDGL